MICPKCRAEYRQGFTVCADCHVALVEPRELAAARGAEPARFDGAGRERVADAGETAHKVEESAGWEPAGRPGDPNEDPFCSFWKGNDPRVHAELCTVLDEADIPHKTAFRQDH